MRTILIIQSLIIVAGAYYIFTLAHTNDESSDQTDKSSIRIEVLEREDGEVDKEAKLNGEENFAETDQIDGDLPLGNDIGMEFPIPDNEADLQVR